ncbi:MAG: MFS transporter [Actinomycetota bacterium]
MAEARKPLIPLLFLGLLAAIQSADPNISSSALLTAGKALDMGTLSALAASISTFVLAATVITTGMMADRLGRRKILMAALLLSAASDILVALSPDVYVYLIGRALAGVGLGAVFGAAFAYVKTFATGKGGLPAALGLFTAGSSLFTLIITFLGSSLVGVDWRLAYVVVPALSLVSIVLALALLPKDGPRVAHQGSWDFTGQLLLAVGIIVFLYGVSHATNGLTSPLTVIPVVVGVVVLALFALWMRKKGEDGVFPIRLFREPIFIAAVLIGLVFNFSNGVLLLSFSNLFQYANDLKGLSLSLMQVPFLLAGIVAALVVGRMRGAGRISQRGAVLVGTVVLIAGLALFAFTAIARPPNALVFLPALLVAGFGLIIPAIPYGGLFLQEADPKHYGAVSSSRTTVGQFWYALGLAGSTVLIDGLTRNAVANKLGPSAGTELEQWSASGGKPSNTSVLPDAAYAFSASFAVTMVVLAVLVAVAGVVAWLLLKRFQHADPPHTHDSHPPVEATSGP